MMIKISRMDYLPPVRIHEQLRNATFVLAMGSSFLERQYRVGNAQNVDLEAR